MALALESVQAKSSSALNSANFSAANASVAGVSAAQKTQSLDIQAIKAWYKKKDYTKDCIKNIQRAVGFTSSKDIDGIVGPNTINKVANWQASVSLTPDGKFGPASAAKAGVTLVTKSSAPKQDSPKTSDPAPSQQKDDAPSNDGGSSNGGGSSNTYTPPELDTTSTDVGAIKVWYAVQGYTKDTIKDIQRAVGFTAAKDIDGSVGPNTAKKVMEWQAANNLTANGRFDDACAQKAGITLTKHGTEEYGGSHEYNDTGKTALLGFTPISKWVVDEKGNLSARNKEDRAKIDNQVTSVTFPVHDENGKDSTKSLTIHQKLAANVRAIFTDIYTKMPSFKVVNVGGYCYRKINGKNKGSKSLSNHSYAAAIDINYGSDSGYDLVTDDKNVVNSKLNPFYTNGKPLTDTSKDTDFRMRTKSHPVVKACADHGFGWGGDYGDYMHFSYFGGH